MRFGLDQCLLSCFNQLSGSDQICGTPYYHGKKAWWTKKTSSLRLVKLTEQRYHCPNRGTQPLDRAGRRVNLESTLETTRPITREHQYDMTEKLSYSIVQH